MFIYNIIVNIGPIPGLDDLNNIPVKATALVLHGAGTSCTYLAALLGMVESIKAGGLPQTEQTTVCIPWEL